MHNSAMQGYFCHHADTTFLYHVYNIFNTAFSQANISYIAVITTTKPWGKFTSLSSVREAKVQPMMIKSNCESC